jgi:hypothetical protein
LASRQPYSSCVRARSNGPVICGLVPRASSKRASTSGSGASSARQRVASASAEGRRVRTASRLNAATAASGSPVRPASAYASIRSGSRCGVSAASDRPFSCWRRPTSSSGAIARSGCPQPSSSRPSAAAARSSREPPPSRPPSSSASSTCAPQAPACPWAASSQPSASPWSALLPVSCASYRASVRGRRCDAPAAGVELDAGEPDRREGRRRPIVAEGHGREGYSERPLCRPSSPKCQLRPPEARIPRRRRARPGRLSVAFAYPRQHRLFHHRVRQNQAAASSR